MGANLTTKEKYKAYVGINSTTKDAEIDTLVPIASAFIKTYCMTSFVDNYDEPKVEVFDGGAKYIDTSEYPIVNVISFEYSVDNGLTYTELAEYTDFVTKKPNGKIISTDRINGFPDRLNGYRVTYTCGYETLPADLELAVLDLIDYYIRNDSSIHSPKAPGSNTVQIDYSLQDSLPGHIRRVLDQYKANAI